jgi:hypothetical protein
MSLPCWFASTDAGLGNMAAAAGSFIALFDKLAVTGFNSKSCTIAVASNVATVACAAHGFSSDYGKRARIAGVTSATSANGIKDITVLNANSFTYVTSGIADGTLTGTITADRAPLGWTKTWTGTNAACYTPDAALVTGDPFVLKITDTFGTYVTMQMGVSHDGSGTLTAGSALTYMGKPNSAAAWYIVGDGAIFYWESCVSATPPESGGADSCHMWVAGRTTPTQTFYGAATILCGRTNSSEAVGNNDADRFYAGISDYTSNITANTFFSLYNYSHGAQNQSMGMMALGAQTSASAGKTAGFAYPSPVNGQFFCSPVYLTEVGTGSSQTGPYCQMPGLRTIHAYFNSNATSGAGARPTRGIFDGTNTNEKLLVLFYQGESAWGACCAFRLDQLWR